MLEKLVTRAIKMIGTTYSKPLQWNDENDAMHEKYGKSRIDIKSFQPVKWH